MATYIQIGSTVTVGSGGAASIDFSSIPSTYTDLVVVLSARETGTSTYGRDAAIQFNGSSANLSSKRVYGLGGGAPSSDSLTSILGLSNPSNLTASTFASNSFYIPNYAGSTYKSVSVDSVVENNATQVFTWLVAGLWSSTAAINQITLPATAGQTFVQYSTASLYGIKKD